MPFLPPKTRDRYFYAFDLQVTLGLPIAAVALNPLLVAFLAHALVSVRPDNGARLKPG